MGRGKGDNRLDSKNILFKTPLGDDSFLRDSLNFKEQQELANELKILSPSSNLIPHIPLEISDGAKVYYRMKECSIPGCGDYCACNEIDESTISISIEKISVIRSLISHINEQLKLNSEETYYLLDKKKEDLKIEKCSQKKENKLLLEIASEQTKIVEESGFNFKLRNRIYDQRLAKNILNISKEKQLSLDKTLEQALVKLCSTQNNFETEIIYSAEGLEERIDDVWIKEDAWNDINKIVEEELRLN